MLQTLLLWFIMGFSHGGGYWIIFMYLYLLNFFSQLERLDCYIRFCSSQSTASVLLQKLIEVKPGFADKLKECQADPRSQGMPLAFYLLKPVKRITEYPILLEKLVKNTPVGHPDLFNVQRALELSRYI